MSHNGREDDDQMRECLIGPGAMIIGKITMQFSAGAVFHVSFIENGDLEL